MTSPSSNEGKILGILDNLLSYEDIYACMVVRKGIEGIIPPEKKFNKKIKDVWGILQETMGSFFEIVDKYSKHGYGLNELFFKVMDYEVIFFILPESDTALVAIIPALGNRGLLELALHKAREDIVKVLDGK